LWLALFVSMRALHHTALQISSDAQAAEASDPLATKNALGIIERASSAFRLIIGT
jgi:hypothetical protein